MMRLRSRFLAFLTLLTLLLTTTSVASATYNADGVTAAAARMKALGVVKGDASGDLKLEGTITRAEMMTIIVRAYGQEEQAKTLAGIPTGFPDVDQTSHWGAPYILLAKRLIEQKGATIGLPGGNFNPNGSLTAAEAIAFQMKFLGLQPKAGLDWPDNFIQGAVDGGLLDKSDATVLDPIKNASATRGLALYLADRAFRDTTPPTVTVDPTYPAESRDGNVTLTGSVGGDAAEVRVAGVPATLADGRWQATVRLGVGKYTVNIEAADAAGNIGRPAQPVVITYNAAPALVFIRDGTVWAAEKTSLDKPFQVSPKGATVLTGNYDAYNEPVVTTDGRWVYYTRLRSLNGVATKAIVRSPLDPAATKQVAEVVLEFPADQGMNDLDLAPGGGILFERGGDIYRIQGTAVQRLTGASGYTKPTAGSGNWLLATARSEVQVQDFALPKSTVVALCSPKPMALTGGDTRVVHQDPAALPDGSGFIYSDSIARRLVVRTWQGEPRTLQFKGLYDDRVDGKSTLSADGTLAFETAMGGPLRIVVVSGVNSDEPIAQFEGRDPSWGRFIPAAATPGPCGAGAAAAPQWEKADLGVKVTAPVQYEAPPAPKPTPKAPTSPTAPPAPPPAPAPAPAPDKADVQKKLAQVGVKDVKSDHWAAKEMAVLVEVGFVKPDAGGNIKPDAGTTVDETAALFAKVLGVASKTDSVEEAAQKAENSGLIKNRPGITRDMTRIEVAYMLLAALDIQPKQATAAEVPFKDFFLMSQDDWGVVTALYEAGIFKGFEDKTFRPNNILTKAQVALLVDRVLGAQSK